MDEQIKSYLFKSVKTLNQNFVLVVVLSLTWIIILSSDIYILSVLAGIIITPVIYGRFFEIPWSTSYSTFPQLFKQHWLNYWIVTFILGTPVFVFGGLVSGFAGFIFKFFLEALTVILGIYAIPLVFITEEKVFPIKSGLRCLWQNLQYSLPLILLTVLIVIIKKLSLIFVFRSFQENYTAMFAVAFIQNIILNYIALSVFMTAVMLLLNKPDFQKYLKP